jgi:hypothetical protein
LPDEVWELIYSKAKMKIHVIRANRRRVEWKRLVSLSSLSRQWKRVVGKESSEDLLVRFTDLNGRVKERIFEKVVDSVAFKHGKVNYFGQVEDCKKLVRCKTLCKNWKYWLSRKTVGKEMSLGLVVVE